MSTPLFASLGAWNWLILAAALITLEVLAPGIFLIWLGLAALVTGLLSFAITLGWQAQILAFAVFTIAAVPAWRHFATRKGNLDAPFLNQRSEALVGREFTLEKPIVDGVGTLRIDDTVWRVGGPNLPAGMRVRIVAADGALLTVARV
jgi:membrane protein implicated in regulation of membrane protease activity